MSNDSKLNQVTIALEADDYSTLAELAKDGDRSNAAQARRMLRKALEARREESPKLASLEERVGEEE